MVWHMTKISAKNDIKDGKTIFAAKKSAFFFSALSYLRFDYNKWSERECVSACNMCECECERAFSNNVCIVYIQQQERTKKQAACCSHLSLLPSLAHTLVSSLHTYGSFHTKMKFSPSNDFYPALPTPKNNDVWFDF